MDAESVEAELCKALTSNLSFNNPGQSVHFLGSSQVLSYTFQNEMMLNDQKAAQMLQGSPSQPQQNANDTMEIESTPHIVFNPPVAIQRYLKVREVLDSLIDAADPKLLKSVLEVGCAKFRLHTYMKRLHESVQRLVYMDADAFSMEWSYKDELPPLCFEYLMKRASPLVVEAYVGDITKCDARILNLDPSLFCVIAIEVIEHLKSEVLIGFEKTVFGVLRPPAVIVTTPNSDFNTVFGLPPGKFRHWDHKFEWSRLEFSNWCVKICQDYPGYVYQTLGIGQGPEGTEQFGCVSQLAVFTRNLDSLPATKQNLHGIVQENCYRLLTRIDYPFTMENRPLDEIILKEFECYVTMYVLNPASINQYMEQELTEIKIPLEQVARIYGMPKDVEKSQIAAALMKAGKVLKLNDAGNDYDVCLPMPANDDWPESGGGDYENMTDSGMDDSMLSNESSVHFETPISDSEEW